MPEGSAADAPQAATEKGKPKQQGTNLEVFNKRFEKYILYETSSFYYLVGDNRIRKEVSND